MQIIATDNLNREHIADRLVCWFPPTEEAKAKEFCDWLNSLNKDDHGGMYHIIVADDYRLSRGMEDLI